MPDYPETVHQRVSIGAGAAAMEAPLNPYGEGRCPECGRDLNEWNPEGQVIEHWGTEPLPIINENYLARCRIAMLRGQELPKE